MEDLVVGDLEHRRDHPLAAQDYWHPLAAEEWLASRVLECIADPRAVCRLALVNKNFAAASISDLVWQKLLPPAPILDPLLAHLNYKPLSKKHLFFYLCNSITYDKGLKKFWLDPATGGECHMISAKALFIAWGNTPQYWQWKPYPGSMFLTVAYLRSVCWFEIKGTFQYLFRPGRYTISFRLQLHSNQGWKGVPIKMCIQNTTYAHPPHESQVLFDGLGFKIRSCPLSHMFATSPKQAAFDREGVVDPCSSTSSKRGGEKRGKKQGGIGQEGKHGQLSGFFKSWRAFISGPQYVEPIKLPSDSQLGSYVRASDNEKINQTCEGEECATSFHASCDEDPHVWVECDAGEFFIEDDNENRPIEVSFSMKEIEVGWWKRGLVLDGVIIRPSYVLDNIVNDRRIKPM